jgi:hypothetical protein
MSLQAQIRQWVDDRLHEILDPLFVRLDSIETYIKAFEDTPVVPTDPAPRGKGPEATAAVQAVSKAVSEEARKTPVTGRPTGRPAATGKATSG